MIRYEDFGRLRLAQFFQPGAEIARLEDWEFMDRLWVGDAVGFTEFLRLRNDPYITRSVALDLADLPPVTSAAILSQVDIPLSRRMSMQQVCHALGSEPIADYRFTDDRETFDFEIGDDEKFDVSCTILKDGGLAYVVIMRRDYLTTPP